MSRCHDVPGPFEITVCYIIVRNGPTDTLRTPTDFSRSLTIEQTFTSLTELGMALCGILGEETSAGLSSRTKYDNVMVSFHTASENFKFHNPGLGLVHAGPWALGPDTGPPQS